MQVFLVCWFFNYVVAFTCLQHISPDFYLHGMHLTSFSGFFFNSACSKGPCRFLIRLNYVISSFLTNLFKVFVNPEDILIFPDGLSDFWQELVICNNERRSVCFFIN